MKKLICATFIGLLATAAFAQTETSQQNAAASDNTQSLAQSKQASIAPAENTQTQKAWANGQNEQQNGQSDGQSGQD